jgi:ribosomal protein L20A (L18A)
MTKQRSIKHPHVHSIIRALDRAEASERTYPDTGMVLATASSIFEWGECCDRFRYPNGPDWSNEQARAVVIAWALNCHEDELRWMAETAREEIKAIVDWDRGGYYECHGHERPRTKLEARELDKLIAADDARAAAEKVYADLEAKRQAMAGVN